MERVNNTYKEVEQLEEIAIVPETKENTLINRKTYYLRYLVEKPLEFN
ncbi:hypothetical protein [Terrisporobacter hibernicus]|uniref:Transposase n=1 Tax=Terrisporobacter hibernicus TaxID=2813371 RepID=A0AAX2ZGT6_9FIRM|nr:hypothetical protein [Terrisporobacter hibernicus]UEL47284.1 hypothetical protein JW646_16875 [Terrisporobacter hibernicus]